MESDILIFNIKKIFFELYLFNAIRNITLMNLEYIIYCYNIRERIIKNINVLSF